MKTLAVVTSVGARTPLGASAKEVGFLLRTGLPAITASVLADTEGEPVTMCFDASLDPNQEGSSRAVELARSAQAEALAPLGQGGRSLRVQLLLAVDSTLASDPSGTTLRPLVEDARAATGELSVELVSGPAAAAAALPRAVAALDAGAVDALLLGGTHSDHDPTAVAALEEAGRLFSPSNLDALVPGESAAFALCMRDDVARRSGLPAWARLRGVGHGVSAARPDNDESAYRAEGLTHAIREACHAMSDQDRAGWGLCDHTFETLRLREWQAMMVRTRDRWGEPLFVDSPAQRLGHVGAAALPLFVALCAEGWRRGYAPSELALVFAGSDTGERGALLLGAP